MSREEQRSSDERQEAVSDELSGSLQDSGLPVVADYDREDGCDGHFAECPHCGTTFTVHTVTGPVIDSNGRRFESIYDTDPSEGPWFCPDCWDELETNRREQQNHSLATFD